MVPAEGDIGTHASTSPDALLRALDAQIASVALARMPTPGGPAGDPGPAMETLSVQVEQLCTQRAVNTRELQAWMLEAEVAARSNDDVRAKEALVRYAEHLRLAQEADALLAEFRSLITEARHALSQPSGEP